jgi:hypothetical protein
MSILAKLGRAAAKKLDEMQGIDAKTPGRTSEDRGVVVGKDRTKAYKNTEQIKGGLKAGAGAAGLGILSAGTGETDTLSDSKKEKTSYSISDLPKEGSATYESEGKTIYTNSKFKKAAQDAEGETFKYKGKTYNVEAVLEALQRLSKAEGGEVDSFRMMYEAFKKEMAAAKNEKEKAAIQERFQAQTQNVDEETKREVYKSMDRQREADGGSMLVPPEMPVDTYTPEEQANAEATQLPDSEMEDKHMDFMLDESLGEEEQDYLMNALESDPKLSEIFDKVIMTASEFSGSGEVEGPGTGVSDSIPARLSDGEFVITRKATDEIGADNLQMMMDQAEREADYGGGMLRKAVGGLLEDPMQSEKVMGQQEITDEEINKSMLSANRMPSLQPSRLR